MIRCVASLPSGSRLAGEVLVPASKSHTIRALLIAAIADGESIVVNPLDSQDARSCLDAIRLLGAAVDEIPGAPWRAERALRIRGVGAGPGAPARGLFAAAADDVIDAGNSGTTLYLAAGLAALSPGWTVLTGDRQVRGRPIQDLLRALNDLGATAFATKDNGCAPIAIRGPMRGGSVTVDCRTSQFLSSLLIALPLAESDSEIRVPILNERPYVAMTLRWLDEQGIRCENVGQAWNRFRIPGRQRYRAFEKVIPGDFSSATFFACAAAITGSKLSLRGLDMGDSQGDKAIFAILAQMGCVVRGDAADPAGGIVVIGPGHDENPQPVLRGGEFDFNAIPDALPAFSVVGCFAADELRMVNVAQARQKETDRITVMQQELTRLGAQVAELPDGLVIRPGAGRLRGTEVDSRGDHRVAMSLALAALKAEGETRIVSAECVAVTLPEFFPMLQRLGARCRTIDQ